MKKLFLYSAFLIFSSAISYGQEIEWQKVIGGDTTDTFAAIHQTVDGGYIVGGSSMSNISGDKTEFSKGYADYWVIKLDSSRNIQWQKTIGGNFNDDLVDVIQTNDGGYILGGTSSSDSTGDKTSHGYGDPDLWIVKTDSLGNIQWQTCYGYYGEDELISIKKCSNGGYFLGFTNGWNTPAPYNDYRLIKLDAMGNIVMLKNYSGNAYDYLTSMDATPDGGAVLGGYSNSGPIGGSIGVLGHGLYDYWVVKIDSLGNLQWQKTYGGNQIERMYSVKSTNDAGFILAGYTGSGINGNKTEALVGYDDYWIVKTDSIGNIQWQKDLGSTEEERLFGINQTNDGGFIIIGLEFGSKISGNLEENGPGFLIIKLDSSGNIQWQNIIAENNLSYPLTYDTEILIDQRYDGNLVFGVASKSNIGRDKTLNCKGASDYWLIELTSNYNLISGKTFIDLNANNSQDISELPLINNKVSVANTSRFAFSNQDGFYAASVLDTGSFTISPTSIGYYIEAPLIQTANFTGIKQIDSLNNFAFQPTGVFNDLRVTLTPLFGFRPGFQSYFAVNYENIGTTTLSGIIKMYADNNLTYASSTLTPSNIYPDSIDWNVGTLMPYQSGSFAVTFMVSGTALLGTLTSSAVNIQPIIGDANSTNNVDTGKVILTSSYDPNDILVNKDTLFTTQLPSQPSLDYTIRFQNTGNDTAFTVNVLNPIDTTKLELSSIEFVNSSHPVNLNWIPWERNMEFKFNNILLPDSNINEPLSHGFVHYRIKPKTTLLAGDSITNNAYIYFDFNAPVATNTAITRIVLPTGIAPLSWGEGPGVRCFPNPAKDEITIAGYTIQNNQPAVLKIYDVMGKEVFSQSIVNRTSQIVDLKSFSSGVYFLQLQTGAKVSRVKFVKQ